MSNSAIKLYFEEVPEKLEKGFYNSQDQAAEFIFQIKIIIAIC